MLSWYYSVCIMKMLLLVGTMHAAAILRGSLLTVILSTQLKIWDGIIKVALRLLTLFYSALDSFQILHRQQRMQEAKHAHLDARSKLDLADDHKPELSASLR